MFHSIGRKLFLGYLLIIIVAISLLAIYGLGAFERFYYTAATDDLINRGRIVREAIKRHLAPPVSRLDVERLLRHAAHPDGATIRVLDPRGTLVASSQQHDPEQTGFLMRLGVREALTGDLATGLAYAGDPASEKLYVALPIQRGAAVTEVLRLSFPLAHFQKARAQMQRAALVALVVTALGCALLSALLAKSIVHPIAQMSAMAARVGAGALDTRVEIASCDELQLLAAALNEMSRRLSEQERVRRDFLANVSHELRTPVSNIRVALEALLSGAAAGAEVQDRLLTGAHGETERLARLVNDLLDLTRLESGAVTLQFAPVPCSALVDRALAAVEARRLAKGLSVETRVTPGLRVLGDEQRLGQSLMNLLDNAIKFSDPGKRIWVRATGDGDGVLIEVADEGPGIPETERGRIFERFYTGSRDRSRNASGTGLGLCISRTIVEAHRGRISVETPPNGGASFCLWLPSPALTNC